MKKYIFIAICILLGKRAIAQSEITTKELKKHLYFLSADKQKGRFPGSPESESVSAYIARQFKKAGLKSYDGTYFQNFTAKIRVKSGMAKVPDVKTCNVIGVIEGSDDVLKNEFIVIGAHYDHLGMGGASSKKPDTSGIHNGADDNASGTAALLELAEKFAAHRKQLKRSVLFIAFGAEEQGLLGSKYFTEHPVVPLAEIKLMLNMDMVGRLNDAKQLYMGGAASFSGGMDLMKSLGPSSGLNPIVIAYDVGGSDHVSFYKKNISVLGMHTGGHPQYHTPEDTVDLINFSGEKLVCDYIYQAVYQLANRKEPILFIPEQIK